MNTGEQSPEDKMKERLNDLVIDFYAESAALFELSTSKKKNESELSERMQKQKERKKLMSDIKACLSTLRQINKGSNNSQLDKLFDRFNEISKSIPTNQGSIVTKVPEKDDL